MEKPQSHYFTVTMEVPPAFSKSGKKTLKAIMPTWTPGSYLIREFARCVLEFSAIDAETKSPLVSYKTSKNCWNVEAGGADSGVIISYKVYAFEYTVDTSYLDQFHGIINGASVFMYVEGMETVETSLVVELYQGWMQISTSLEEVKSDKDKSRTFRVPNFDILVDSPIEIGNHEVRSFTMEGIVHEVSLFGEKSLDNDSFVSDLVKIVDKTWRVFGVIPYKRYLFLVDFAEGPKGGGLEHLSSTHCIVPRFRLMPQEEYHALLSLFSHEFFHAWNVKRMRPVGLGPFDYTNETYSKSLWIAEGFTSYFDLQILRRAEIFSPEEYLDALSKRIDYVKSLPAWQYESAEESSFNTWIGHYRPDENTNNVRCSYYEQGSIIALMLDMEIRKSTSSSKTLDDALRILYNQSFVKDNRGYTNEELEAICIEIAGRTPVKQIFDSRVRGREAVDFDRFLGYAGLRLGPKSKREGTKGYLGIKTKSEDGKLVVASRLFESPAEAAGISSGDELIAINKLRIDSASLPFMIANSKPGEEMEVVVARDGVLRTLNASVVEAPYFENRIYKLDTADPEQKQLFQNWVSADWNDPLVYREFMQSPHKLRQLDYV